MLKNTKCVCLEICDLSFLFRFDQDDFFFVFPQNVNLVIQSFFVQLK